jgi:hypothetical protein
VELARQRLAAQQAQNELKEHEERGANSVAAEARQAVLI